MKPWLRQGIWLAVALIVPVLLSLALLPLRDHVSDVLIALVLLTVSATAVARGELLLSLVAATSTALSFDYFFTVPYEQFAIRGAQGVVTTVALIAAIPALGAWIGRLYGKEAARERELREKAERYAEELAERQRQVEQLAAELTASRRRILAVGDEMRRRIERDLHDGVQQHLVTLSLLLRGIRDRAPGDVRADVDEVCDGLARTLEELRDLSRGLHPAVLVEAGLGPAVRALARRSPLPVRVQVRAEGRLPGSCEATAYYVAAEAFTNAAKHAAASAVDILIERADGALTVQVRDDGVGGADVSRGSGLIGLRDRVEAVGGTMTLDSPARAGTILTVRLPVIAGDHLSRTSGGASPAGASQRRNASQAGAAPLGERSGALCSRSTPGASRLPCGDRAASGSTSTGSQPPVLDFEPGGEGGRGRLPSTARAPDRAARVGRAWPTGVRYTYLILGQRSRSTWMQCRIVCSTAGRSRSWAKVTSPSTTRLDGPTTMANRSGTSTTPGCSAMTWDISRSMGGGTPRPDRRSRFVRSKSTEASRSSRPMSALATVSGAGFPVTWLRMSPAVAVMPPITEQPPPTTTVVDAGSVLRPR